MGGIPDRMNISDRYDPPPADNPLDALVTRVRGEFLETPGRTLTMGQAEQLLALDHEACERVLTAVVETGFLVRSRRDAYLRA